MLGTIEEKYNSYIHLKFIRNLSFGLGPMTCREVIIIEFYCSRILFFLKARECFASIFSVSLNESEKCNMFWFASEVSKITPHKYFDFVPYIFKDDG